MGGVARRGDKSLQMRRTHAGLSVAEAGFELEEESVQGVDVVVLPAGEDVIGLGGDAPKGLFVGHRAGSGQAVAPQPGVAGIGVART